MENEQAPLVLERLSFYDLLESRRRNFSMFLGRYSLELLDTYLSGLWDAYIHGNFPLTNEMEEFRGFNEFVRKKYRRSNLSRWRYWIIERIGQDGEEAVAEFYRLFDEFRKKKQKEREREARKRRIKSEIEAIIVVDD